MNEPICIAVPIRTANIENNKENIQLIKEEHPQYIEYRFDYIGNPDQITSELLELLIRLADVPVIFTLRRSLEGGHLEIDNSERLIILKKLIKANPQYLDIELGTSPDIIQEVIELCIEHNVKIIGSYHNFQKTEPFSEAERIIENFLVKLKVIVGDDKDMLIADSFVFKLIFTATHFEDNLIPLRLCKKFSSQGYQIISFCMDELGIFSRIMCIKAGSLFTYAGHKDATAPGQLNITTMRSFFSFI